MSFGGQTERNRLISDGAAWLQASLGDSAAIEVRELALQHGGGLVMMRFAIALTPVEALPSACALSVLVPAIPGFCGGHVSVAQVSIPETGADATILLSLTAWRCGAQQEAA